MGLCLSVNAPVKSRNKKKKKKQEEEKKKKKTTPSPTTAALPPTSHHSSPPLSRATVTTDEDFYDALSWLDPVEGDDFCFSGEPTPLCENTHLGRSFSHGYHGTKPSSPPGEFLLGNPSHSKSERLSINTQKRLGDLFKESFRDHQLLDDEIELGKGGKTEAEAIALTNGELRNGNVLAFSDSIEACNVGRAETLDDGMLAPTQCCFSGRSPFEKRRKMGSSGSGKNHTR